MGPTDTRQRLLDVAEDHFGRYGYEGASSRGIIAAAGCGNIAAVHYYFGSKKDLFVAVIERRLGPLNEERIRRLDLLDSETAPVPADVTQITRALIEPVFDLVDSGHLDWLRLLARSRIEPGDHWDPVIAGSREMFHRFANSFIRALPDMRSSDVAYGVYLLAGSVVHALVDDRGLALLGSGLEDFRNDRKRLYERLLAFMVTGMQAGLSRSSDASGSPAGIEPARSIARRR